MRQKDERLIAAVDMVLYLLNSDEEDVPFLRELLENILKVVDQQMPGYYKMADPEQWPFAPFIESKKKLHARAFIREGKIHVVTFRRKYHKDEDLHEIKDRWIYDLNNPECIDNLLDKLMELGE